MDDGMIVELFFARDHSAIDETAKKYGRFARSIAQNILPSPQDAEECVNDALYNMWNSIPPERPVALKAFFASLTRCACLKKQRELRAGKRGGGETALALDELEDCVPSGSAPDREVEAKELARAVGAFVRTLGGAERNIFICRYWYIMPVGAIARRYGYSVSRVKSTLFRTRKKLREYLVREELI